MSRDRFVKTEWGEHTNKNSENRDFGFCDHGWKLQTCDEKEVYGQLKAEGYTVHKHGWPDFMATRGEETRLIEVKSSADSLRVNQIVVKDGLARLGAEVEIIVIENEHRPRRIGWKPKPLKKRIGTPVAS
jgi:hypothetical protein